MKTIEEGNKLIAEFDGWIQLPDFINSDKEVYPYYQKGEKLIHYHPNKYHSDWSWLMPVVEKIESMKSPVYIHSNCCTIYEKVGKDHGMVLEEYGETKIEAAWKSVVRFIKFKN